MSLRMAFECFGDEDVYRILRECFVPRLGAVHSGSQGEVVNEVLVRHGAQVGMVDEDPGRTHHRRRDQLPVVATLSELEVRGPGDRRLFILKPDLEGCFLRNVARFQLETGLPGSPESLHRQLAVAGAGRPVHRKFQDALRELARREGSFVTEIGRILKVMG